MYPIGYGLKLFILLRLVIFFFGGDFFLKRNILSKFPDLMKKFVKIECLFLKSQQLHTILKMVLKIFYIHVLSIAKFA